MADKTIVETQAVVESFFDGRAPRGVVTESTIKQTINSILTRTHADYVVPFIAYNDADKELVETGLGTTASTMVVTPNEAPKAAVPAGADPILNPAVPAVPAKAGTIVITDYDPTVTYTLTPTVNGNQDQSEFKIVTGDQGNAEVSYQPWDKVNVNYQSGVLTIQGKITEEIIDRPIVIVFENAYFDRVEVVMLLAVSLPAAP